MHQLPNLNDVLLYKNPTVITRFKINVPAMADQAEQLFAHTIRYLWLCEKHHWDLVNNPNDPRLQFIPVMHEEMRAIDSMWHEFILVTRDYHEFCQHYFGHYLHHEPNMNETLNYSEEQFVTSLHLFLDYTYDVLGEEVIKDWFQTHL